jgi:hypothetical protein
MKKAFYIFAILLLLPACSEKQDSDIADTAVGAARKQHSGQVSVRIVNATAQLRTTKILKGGREVWTQELDIECEVELKNDTGSALQVESNFYSAFDGLVLVIMDSEGKEVCRQWYTHHQSPFTPEPRTFELPIGITRKKLSFPVHLGKIVGKLKVKIVGGLRDTDYESGLESNIVDIVVKKVGDAGG